MTIPAKQKAGNSSPTPRDKLAKHPLLLAAVLVVVIIIGVLLWVRVGYIPASQNNLSPKSPAPTSSSLKIPPSFSLQQKIGQLLVVGVTSQAMAIDLEKNYQIGGFLLRPDSGLFDSASTDAIRHAGVLPPLLAVDEEGGEVARLPGNNFSTDSAAYMSTLPDLQVEQIGFEMGQAMTAIGANVDFAPVLDLNNGRNTAISYLDRSFSRSPAVVAQKAAAFAHGLRRAGVVPTFKHFPGLGNATGSTGGNTDTGPATTPPLSELEKSDLAPYKTLLQGDKMSAVMVGNQIVPGLSAGQPASLSNSTYDLLRQRYGFKQVVFTDELLLAKAVSQVESSPSAAVIAAIEAGADMPLIDPDNEQEVGTIIGAISQAVSAGQISIAQINSSLSRILGLKSEIMQGQHH